MRSGSQTIRQVRLFWGTSTLLVICHVNKIRRSFYEHVEYYSVNNFQWVQNMKKLLICCLFGNTANSLAKRMQLLAEKEGHHLIISAVGLDNFASVAPAFDGFLIAPDRKSTRLNSSH